MQAFSTGLVIAIVFGASACSAPKSDCIGKPGAVGAWADFADGVGDGRACSTVAGDLHVTYTQTPSDLLAAQWEAVAIKRGLVLQAPWGASGDFRQAWFQEQQTSRRLNVSIVGPSSRGPAREVRLTWEP